MIRAVPTCPTCRAWNTLTPIGAAQSGAPLYRCTYCGYDAIYHTSPFHMQSWWLPVLEAGVSTACPTCGVVEQVTKTISQSPNAPASVQEIARAIAVGALVVGAFIGAVSVVKAIQEAA
jgi:hypothetical protein